MKNHVIRKLISLVTVLVLVLSVACTAADTITAPVRQNSALQLITGSDLEIVTSAANAPYLYPGETMQLSVAPDDKYTAQSWASSNESIATVDSTGLVTAVAPGTMLATVTVEGGFKQEYQVIVLNDSTVYTIAYHVTYPKDAYTFVFNKEVKRSRPVTPQNTTFTEDYQGVMPGTKVNLNDGSYIQTVNYKVTKWINADDPSKEYQIGEEIQLTGNLNLNAYFEKTLEVEKDTPRFKNQYLYQYIDKQGVLQEEWREVESAGILYKKNEDDAEFTVKFMVAANAVINFYYSGTYKKPTYEIKLIGFRLSDREGMNTAAVKDYLGNVYSPGQLIELPYQSFYYFEPVFSEDNNKNTVVVIRKQKTLSEAYNGQYSDAFYYYVGQGVLSDFAVQELDSVTDYKNWGKVKGIDGSSDEVHIYSVGGTTGTMEAYSTALEDTYNEENGNALYDKDDIPDIKHILAALGETVAAEDSLEVVFFKIGRTGKGYTLDGILRKKGVKHNITVIDTVTGKMVGTYTFDDQAIENVYQLGYALVSDYSAYTFKSVSFDPDGKNPVKDRTVAIDQDCTIYLCYEDEEQAVYHKVRFLDEEGRDVYNLDAENRSPYYQYVKHGDSALVADGVEKEGYHFDGWYTTKQSEGGGTEETRDTIPSVTTDIDYYARFTRLTGSITIRKELPGDPDNNRNFTVRVFGFEGDPDFRNVTVPANGDSVTLSNVPTGEYRVEEVLLGADSVNYQVGYSVRSFSVESKRDVSITVTNKPVIDIYIEGNTGEFTYNGSPQKVSGYSAESVSPLFDESKIVLSGGAAEVTETDICTEKPMGLTEDRFSYSDDNIVAVFHVTDGWITINPAAIQITVTGDRKAYTYDGTPKTAEGYTAESADTLFDAGKVAMISGEAKVTETDPGEYPMGLTVGQFAYNDPNVTATFTVNDGQLDIINADLVITITGNRAAYAYDKTEKAAVGYTAACDSELFEEGKIVFSGSAKVSGTDAGSYPMGLSESQFRYDDNKVNAAFIVTDGSLQINPVPVTVEISGNRATLPYSGLAQRVDGYNRTISNPLYTDDDYSFTGTAAAAGTDTGVYPMGLTRAQCTNLNSNFAATFIVNDGQLEITPVWVTVTADDKEKYISEADPELTARVTGLVNGESAGLIAYDIIRDEGEAVGEYPIMPFGEERQGNYLVRYIPGTLTIRNLVTLTVRKVWDDDNNAAGNRPASLDVVLYGDNQVVQTVTLSESNLWQAEVQVPEIAGTYNWIEPDIPGYDQVGNETTGMVTTLTNRIIPIIVPEQEYTLTIHYQDVNGNPMANDYTGTYLAGDAYRVNSPVFDRFQTNTTVVAGNMPAQNQVITVIYVTVANPGQNNGNPLVLVPFDEYRVPLGLGSLSLNIGDAFE